MVSSIHGISHMDSQDLAGLVCHPPAVIASVFWHNQCYQAGGQVRSVIGATTCIDCLWQSFLIRTLQQIFPSLLLSSLCTY
jgi:hypothetical protein